MPEEPPRALPRIETFGDAAVLVTLGESPDLETNRRVHRLAAAINRNASATGIGRPVAGYATLLVPFDPGIASPSDADAVIRPLLDDLAVASRDGLDDDPVIIPVRYGAEDGPDLDELAERHGLRATGVVEIHAGRPYDVLFLGFAPGFGYLAEVAREIATPRRDTPRPRVPAGSIGIAENLTCVYPSATPGGWNLIGRTSATMWDLTRSEPAVLAPGRRVRFVPVR
jgi:KipI family sensor histidine kinase inhibitor